MGALLMLAAVFALILVGAFRSDRYDDNEGDNNGCNDNEGRSSRTVYNSQTRRNARASHRSIDAYERHSLNHTQKQR